MRAQDGLHFAIRALGGAPLRSGLMLLAMAIGVASVIVLSALGEGARRYVTGEFSSLGTHLLIVLPGRNETTGGAPPLTGETPRDLTLEDAEALARSRHIRHIAPVNVGTANASWRQREREVVVLGASAEMRQVRQLTLAQGRFLPPGDIHHPSPVCVLGATLRQELFGNRPVLGEWLRLGDRRFRIIGVLAQRGQSLGLDTDDMVIVPVTSAQMLFNTASLFRILVEAKSREVIELARRDIIDIVRQRHEGEEDITVITQDAVLSTFDRIFRTLTYTVAGIAAISLVVAGVLIMNIMLVAVSQRRSEIGLLKALGTSARQIRHLFLTEAALLSLLGALLGLGIGLLGSWALRQFYPVLDFSAPLWAQLAALLVALATGIVFGVMPARRAAVLDPIEALARR